MSVNTFSVLNAFAMASLSPYTSYPPLEPGRNPDTSIAKKERKARARMLTARRMAEIAAGGGGKNTSTP